MNILKLFLKFIIILITMVSLIDIAYAKRGCCSWHGGVKNCDQVSGRIVCNDGTYSPSCMCEPYSKNPKFRGSTDTHKDSQF